MPGFYKIFDEILVNAADNKVRDPTMSEIRVSIDVDAQTISVKNDGRGIPIEVHSKEGIWVPELIFGNLLTSSNYDDDEEKTTGGRNGYGAKLANIYSNRFVVETCSRDKKYRQVFEDNMSVKGKPKVTDNKRSEKEYTLIEFKPDLARFSMADRGFDDDILALLHKRVWDMAGILKKVKVYLDGKLLRCKDFKTYVDKFLGGVNEVATGGAGGGKKKGKGSKDDDAVSTAAQALLDDDDLVVGATEPAKPTVVFETYGDRWEVAFAVSDGQFSQVSYCNGIATTKGGTHVAYVADQIVAGLVDLVKRKNKAVAVRPFQIKNHLSIFVNCLVNNPSFDSQTKENMTLSAKKFGSKCELSEDFLKKGALRASSTAAELRMLTRSPLSPPPAQSPSRVSSTTCSTGQSSSRTRCSRRRTAQSARGAAFPPSWPPLPHGLETETALLRLCHTQHHGPRQARGRQQRRDAQRVQVHPDPHRG